MSDTLSWPGTCTKCANKIDELTRRNDRSHSTAGRLAEHEIDEIWWNMMKYDEIWWNMMKYDEIWWNMMKYDEIWWNGIWVCSLLHDLHPRLSKCRKTIVWMLLFRILESRVVC
jgi:hypothetical protein